MCNPLRIDPIDKAAFFRVPEPDGKILYGGVGKAARDIRIIRGFLLSRQQFFDLRHQSESVYGKHLRLQYGSVFNYLIFVINVRIQKAVRTYEPFDISAVFSMASMFFKRKPMSLVRQ